MDIRPKKSLSTRSFRSTSTNVQRERGSWKRLARFKSDLPERNGLNGHTFERHSLILRGVIRSHSPMYSGVSRAPSHSTRTPPGVPERRPHRPSAIDLDDLTRGFGSCHFGPTSRTPTAAHSSSVPPRKTIDDKIKEICAKRVIPASHTPQIS